MQRPALSVVIPAYNEAQRLGATLERIDAFLGGRGDAYELIIVDDGSRDATAALARAFRPRCGRLLVLQNRRNRGKGASVRRGVAAARGERILFTDADLSTPIADLLRLEDAVDQGAAIAIGSRAVPGANVVKAQPWPRVVMGKTFNRFVQCLVLPGLHDTQCGFKLFTRAAARTLFPQQTLPGFGFDVEILYLARCAGWKVAEVPVEWVNSLASRVSPVRDSLRMFWDLFRIRARHRRRPQPGRTIT